MSTATEKETQTWYRVSVGFDLGKIRPFEVVRITEKFVTYLEPGWKGRPPVERREGKDTAYYEWYPTMARAVERGREMLTQRRDTLRAQLEHAEAALAAFNAEHPED